MIKPSKEDKKKEIAVKALDVFAKYGFHQTSIRDLANTLNLSKGTLYDYFDSKEDIIRYAAKEYLAVIYQSEVEIFRKAIGEKELTPREAIKTFFDLSLNRSRDIHKYVLILNEIGTITLKREIPEIGDLFGKILDELASFIKEILIRAQKESSITASADPESMAVFLVCGMMGLSDLSDMFNDKFDINRIADNFTDALFREKEQ
jgi:AcrR family transcriptional regulator